MAAPSRPTAVLVTGSSSGIGAAIARRYAADGCRVAVNSSRSVDAGTALAGEIGGIYVRADVSDADQCRALVDRVVTELGGLDVLVNCAGTTVVIPHDDLDAATPEIWRHLFDVNVLGPWSTITAALASLREHGAGQIINVSSLAGVRPVGSSIPYAVSKAALNHMTLLLARALGPEIRVNAVAPGLVNTPWSADWHEARERVSTTVPLRRPAEPEDVAEVCFALSRSAYVTGVVVPVDGGMSLL